MGCCHRRHLSLNVSGPLGKGERRQVIRGHKGLTLDENSSYEGGTVRLSYCV